MLIFVIISYAVQRFKGEIGKRMETLLKYFEFTAILHCITGGSVLNCIGTFGKDER